VDLDGLVGDETKVLPKVVLPLCFWKSVAMENELTSRNLDICRSRCEGYGRPDSRHLGVTDCKIYHLWRERK